MATPKSYNKVSEVPGVIYTPETLSKFEGIVNSRGYRNKLYNNYKEVYDSLKQAAIRSATKFTSPADIKQTVIDAGITPNTPVLNIGTSERLKTGTINADPGKLYLHYIYTGIPWEQGLEVVRKVPESEWMPLVTGSRAHFGKWTPGLTRKAKKFGGKLEKEV